jgi:hypothetical protein
MSRGGADEREWWKNWRLNCPTEGFRASPPRQDDASFQMSITWIHSFSFSATNGSLSWIVPAEIFDTRTRSTGVLGVSIVTLVSFAFKTMIGQVTPIALEKIGYKFYYLLVSHTSSFSTVEPRIDSTQIVCNFANAVFFWTIQLETAKRPPKEMNYLFANAPLFVPSMNWKDYEQHDLVNRVTKVEKKGSVSSHVE